MGVSVSLSVRTRARRESARARSLSVSVRVLTFPIIYAIFLRVLWLSIRRIVFVIRRISHELV